jgi:hypothetical protein
LETAIIIIFPASPTELVPGLKESQGGGSFKTKILKPMAEVDEDDILDALPPAFHGGRRSMERLCIRARDVMIAQITQLFGEEAAEKEDRHAMALYMQQCLQQYMDRDCVPPELDQPYPDLNDGNVESTDGNADALAPKDQIDTAEPSTKSTTVPAKGNIVIRRGKDHDSLVAAPAAAVPTGNNGSTNTTISTRPAPPKHQRAIQRALNSNGNATIARLFEREHAPGIRQAGCPCCDPENPSALMENMMML